jgi:hypothetical protein
LIPAGYQFHSGSSKLEGSKDTLLHGLSLTRLCF